MVSKWLRIVAWLALGVCPWADPGPARGREAAPPGVVVPAPAGAPDLVTLHFDAVDLVDVIHVLARHLRLNYVIDPEVQGVVTISGGQGVKREDLLSIFHEVLRIHGAVAVKQGALYRITPMDRAPGLAVLGGAGGSGLVMRILPVRYFPVTVIKRLLEPFMSQSGTVLDHVHGNYLVVVDLPSNIRRLSEIQTLIDVETFAGTRMELYKPKVAAAHELAREMSAAMRFSGAAAQGETFAARFLPLPRINQLLVIAYSEAAWSYVKHWIERIDVADEDPGRKLFIRPIENREAKELARVLNQVYGARRSSSGAPAARPVTRPGAGADSLRGPEGGRGAGSLSGRVPSRKGAAATLTGGAESGGPPVSRPPAPGSGEGVRVVAEPDTNSLVILATAGEYADIAGVLERLDLVPCQVLMEVLVAEVTLTDDFEFGVEYALSRGGFSPRAADVDPPAAGAGFQTLESGFTSVVDAGRDFRLFVRALMRDARVRVLSSPHLLAVDNRPARIRVGSEQPVATGTVASQEARVTTTTIDFKNVGRILTVVPQVNSQGFVNLQVRVEVSDVGERVVVGGQSFDAFNVRDAETTAVLQDGQTLVIGGIITDNVRRTRIGIPLLMDLPLLGPLFRRDLQRSDRTELVILITPRVIRNRQQGEQVTERFLDKVRAVRRELEAGGVPPGESSRSSAR